jgi:arylformamidase
MKILDISVPLRAGMPTWPGSAGCRVERTTDQAMGDDVTNSAMHIDLHCGTHIDAPLHFMQSGCSIEQIDIEACIGPAYVADLRGVPRIGASELQERVPSGTRRLLLKTDNSRLWAQSEFVKDFTALTLDGAQWVADQGIWLIANDYLSVQLFRGDDRTHMILMEQGVVILEGVDLTAVEPGGYHLVCLPLRIAGAEAAPSRAVLMLDEVSVP